MRLIGIQALLTLLPHRVAAEAHAFGLGDDVAVSNAGVVAQAAGIGAANGNLTFFLGSQAISQGHGLASGGGTSIGTVFGNASASGVGSAAALSGPANAFLARTSGLDSTHTTAYTNLINGLVSDGVWSKLDVLYIFATQNTTTALLNLVSSGFSGIVHGSPSFTADRGYTGVDASTIIWIDSGFNPTTASSPQFTTNSCHVSAWADTNILPSAGGGIIIGADTSPSNVTNILPRYSDGNAYFRINDGTQNSSSVASSSSVGHWVASRTGSSASAGYNNGSLLVSPNAAAGSLLNRTIFILAGNRNTTPSAATGSGTQVTMASIGSGLTATDATNFYNRLRTYMSAVGVP